MNVLRVVKKLLGIEQVDEEVARRLEQQREERADRLVNDPFSFASWKAFRAYRAARGLRTPRRPPPGSDRDFYAGPDRLGC